MSLCGQHKPTSSGIESISVILRQENTSQKITGQEDLYDDF